MNELDQLAQHRDAILLAEVAAWLHDDFKHTDQHIGNYVANAPKPAGRQDTADLVPGITIDFLAKNLQFNLVKNRKQEDFVDGYLNRCHYTAHIEKEDGNRQQCFPAYLSSPFGFEASIIPANLTSLLRSSAFWRLIAMPLSDRKKLRKHLSLLFDQVGGDTRRPGNEITLWEWGHTVGALYKSALVGAHFEQANGQAPTPANDLRWRLFSIRTDGLAYITTASRLPDLMARQRVLQSALDDVQVLMEDRYPLATEVYRDENGSLYVVPNLPDLLNLQDNEGRTLHSHILAQFVTDGEIVPDVRLDPTAWWGQDPNRAGNDEIPPAGAILSSPITLQSDESVVSKAWTETRQEICPICGLRPCVNQQVDYCQVCGDRRKGRVTEWLKGQSRTIWLDEVADGNGRVALITGSFDLTKWLDGTLVQTMLVQEPTASNLPVPKTASFARLRRIWRTTQTFWQESQAAINQTLSDARRRLKIHLANTPSLTTNQTYELDLRGKTRMSVLWDGQHLLSTDNLSYTAVQLGMEAAERRTPADAALSVGAWLEGCKGTILQLISDDEKNRRFDIQIADIDYQDAAYSTAIPILAEPRTFMALVPADKALDVIDAIRARYAREMGKVRNRLPLHLGAVYFHRRTPLRAALDAGRRMLKYELGSLQQDVWTVQEVTCGGRKVAPQALTQDTKQFDQTIAVKLAQNERSLTWHVPAVMGDGVTPDNWYPYVFIQNDVNGRPLTFKGVRPTGDGQSEQCWLIHASQLKAGDQVYFTPATFDFEWLDSGGQRFAIAYNQGRRRGSRTRPYLLDDLETLQRVWETLSAETGLSSSQIYALRDLVETKRDTWQADDTFAQLCADAVRNAQWKDRQSSDLTLIIDAAKSGLLTEVIQLYMGIMKCKPQREDETNA